jgi:hypothetical protein
MKRRWVMRSFLLLLLLALLTIGCSGKQDENKKSGDDSKVMDRDEGPPKTDRKPPRKDDDLPKKDGEPPVNPPSVGEVKSEVISQEFRDDAEKAKTRYHGKVLQVTGRIEEMGLTATGDAYIVLEGVQVPVARTVEFIMGQKDPWREVVPGQDCILKGRCEYLGGELRFKEGKVLPAAGILGPTRIRVAPAVLSASFEKDAAAAEKQYGGRYLELTGAVGKVEDADNALRLTLNTVGKVGITCHFEGAMAERARRLKPGAQVKLVGKLDSYNPTDGITLKGCLLFD